MTNVKTQTITSVLVANRGEIARRVFATCRARGSATVAVHSDADATSPHVLEADSAVRLPGVSSAETYLRGDLIIEAARKAGADAIHPGYGFLSENAGFARAVREAGLVWIGPDPDAIDLMGSKVESKARMAQAGVPVLEKLAVDDITQEHLPVLVKASAGGGGRGMRIVRELSELTDAVASASREAGSAFGDDTVFCEQYLEAGHHVEVQVMSDAHGTVWALGERECSLQRRHQKVIEEAPSPLVDRVGGDMRERLLAAARDAAASVGYRGAGTVEFLADERGRFWFLEMNTRLQVEHPVTESVTGLDLVALQLDVAEGRALTGDEPTMSGHSIEARLYAEDPAAGWTPTSGTLDVLEIPQVATEFEIPPNGGVRLDAGVRSGDVVSVHYDPMLAKVISRAADRESAVRLLASVLRRARIHGFTTNRDLLVASLLHPEFLDGTADTRFYTQHEPGELLDGTGEDPALAAVAAALANSAAERATSNARVPAGFRTLAPSPQSRRFSLGENEIEVVYRHGRDGVTVDAPASPSVVSVAPDEVRLEIDGVVRRFEITRYGSADEGAVAVDSPLGSVRLGVVPRFVDPSVQMHAGALVAPMPGTVTRLAVEVGDEVSAGQPLLWLEAMKMEHSVTAATDGVVSEVSVQVGAQVEQGAVLVVVDEESPQSQEEDNE